MSLQQTPHFQLMLPPQEPVRIDGNLGFLATLYTEGMDAGEFRSMVRDGGCAVRFRLLAGSSDAAALFENDAELSHSFSRNDVSLILLVPVSMVEPSRSYVLELACVGAGDRLTRHAASYLALRYAEGWA